MNIYVLKLNDESNESNYIGHVVIARSAWQARILASKVDNKEYKKLWLEEVNSTITRLGSARNVIYGYVVMSAAKC